MRTQDAYFHPDVSPTPIGWRVALLLCLLSLMPLWAGLLLPLRTQLAAAMHGKGDANEPFAIALEGGHRLVCEGCRTLAALLQRTSPVGSTHQAVRPAPNRKPLANAMPAAPAVLTQFANASTHTASRHSGAASFTDDIERTLPRYRDNFEEAARRNGLDWRLLAAVGYQESRWNPTAESPTGVRGLMMLTTGTALDLGVNREDGAQSIAGAGYLLQSLFEQLPSEIREPDRTAMALAAYNQGIGHLLDARDVAVNLGGDPDRWSDVRKALPLLSNADWQKTTKYGFARGSEAVAFVDSVDLYYTRLMAIIPAEVSTKGNFPRAASSLSVGRSKTDSNADM